MNEIFYIFAGMKRDIIERILRLKYLKMIIGLILALFAFSMAILTNFDII